MLALVRRRKEVSVKNVSRSLPSSCRLRVWELSLKIFSYDIQVVTRVKHSVCPTVSLEWVNKEKESLEYRESLTQYVKGN